MKCRHCELPYTREAGHNCPYSRAGDRKPMASAQGKAMSDRNLIERLKQTQNNLCTWPALCFNARISDREVEFYDYPSRYCRKYSDPAP